MTTADGMHPAFSGRHPKLLLISDIYRIVTEIAEVHADIARSFSKCYLIIIYIGSILSELKKAFLMFEKGGKNKMAARDLGELLRCLGWNPSERELEEAKHELVVSGKALISFLDTFRAICQHSNL